MASLGFTKGQGASAVQPLQRAWTDAIEGQLQSDEDRLEALKAVHDGIAAAIRGPVLFAMACLGICAGSALAVAALKVAEVFGG